MAEPKLSRDAETSAGPPAASDARIPEQVGRYKIERLLGRGRLGPLYLATEAEPARRVALRVLDLAASREVSERAGTAAKALAALDSEHIVKVHEAALEGSPPHVATEYVDGLSLEQVL